MNINKEIDYLNYQIIISLIVIVTVIVSIFLTYNEKLGLEGKKSLFNKKTTQSISYLNRFIILITSILFLYINYRLYDISKNQGENLKNYYLQIIASVLSVIAAMIALYVVYNNSSVSDVENPII